MERESKTHVENINKLTNDILVWESEKPTTYRLMPKVPGMGRYVGT